MYFTTFTTRVCLCVLNEVWFCSVDFCRNKCQCEIKILAQCLAVHQSYNIHTPRREQWHDSVLNFKKVSSSSLIN